MTVLLLASARTAAEQTIREFPIPTAAANIVAGPDGALWFTEPAGNKIGRITTTGEYSEFVIPTPNSGPLGITVGSDGALWFTERPGNKIGRITTTGTVTEFLLTPGAPQGLVTLVNPGIAAGPDGALWFGIPTARWPAPPALLSGEIPGVGSRSIGRITTTGEFSEFVIPTPNRTPLGMTVGSDGALWFPEWTNAGYKIGRITTTGEFSEFLIPTPNSRPLGITAGSDGALWFTEHAGNKIGRITTTGEFSEFLIPTPKSGPIGVTAGTDGAVWFTQGNKIGRIGQIDKEVKADLQTFHWERWILYLEMVISSTIIIAGLLKRLEPLSRSRLR